MSHILNLSNLDEECKKSIIKSKPLGESLSLVYHLKLFILAYMSNLYIKEVLWFGGFICYSGDMSYIVGQMKAYLMLSIVRKPSRRVWCSLKFHAILSYIAQDVEFQSGNFLKF